jgi:SAM-dependent methyltransferase
MMENRDNDRLLAHYAAGYYDKVYAGFSDDGVARRWALGCLAVMGLAKKDYTRALEFGAGLGQTLATVSAVEKWAVDINLQSRIACESKGFKWCDSLDSVPDLAFDLIISRHSLEHVPSPYDTLQALRRKITPEGRMFLVVPLEDAGIPDDLSDYDEHCHLFSWTPLTLKNLLLATGWKIDLLKIHNGMLFHRSLSLLGAGTAVFLAFRTLATRFGPLRSAEIVAACSSKDGHA